MKLFFYPFVSLFLISCSMYNKPNNLNRSYQQPPVQITETNSQKSVSIIEKYIATDASIAFITEGNGEMYNCKIINNTLTNCVTTGNDKVGRDLDWSPNAVDLVNIGNISHLYVVGAENIYDCQVGNNDQLTNCSKIVALDNFNKPMEWLPLDIDFLKLNNQTYVYITGVTKVYKCKVTNTGFSECAETGQAFASDKIHWLPTNLDVGIVNNIPYAYVVSTNAIIKCMIDNNANLTTCDKTGVGIYKEAMDWHPNGIMLYKPNESTTYAYVTDQSHIYKCGVRFDGYLEGCVETGVTSKNQRLNWLPNSIAINQTKNSQVYAYIAGVYGLYSCAVDSWGSLNSCIAIDAPKLTKGQDWNPKGILLF